MADITASNIASQSGNVIVKAFAAVGNWLISISEASSRTHRVEQLQSLSDAQLAEIGIRRDEIVRYVFRDYYYV